MHQLPEPELVRLNRLTTAGEMAAILAHELNQPLGAIRNYVAGIAEQLGGGAAPAEAASIRAALAAISREVDRAGKIVGGLREFVGDRPPRRTRVSPRRVLHDAVERIAPYARSKGAAIALRVARQLPSVRADATQIEQVVLNLVANAVEALQRKAPRRPAVSVAARMVGPSELEVAVRDNGGGVPAALRDRLFEGFVSTKKGGLGMGLRICRLIVESHGGRIWIVHRRGGTTVHFTLPAAKAESERQQ